MGDIAATARKNINISDPTDDTKRVDVTTVAGKNKLETTAVLTGTVAGFLQQPPKTFTKEFTGQQKNVTVLTPASGKKIQVFGVMVDSDSVGNQVSAQIDFLTSVILIWKNYGTERFSGSWIPMTLIGAVDEVITLNTQGFNKNNNLFLIIAFDEV